MIKTLKTEESLVTLSSRVMYLKRLTEEKKSQVLRLPKMGNGDGSSLVHRKPCRDPTGSESQVLTTFQRARRELR